MKRILIIALLLTGTTVCTMAQTHIDAQPQRKCIVDAGPLLSAAGFTPASTLSFIPNAPQAAGATDAPIGRIIKHVPYKSAAVHYSYSASGTSEETQQQQAWTMFAGTLQDGTPALQDVIPDCFNAGGLGVPYTITGNTLVIPPAYIGYTGQYHVYLLGYKESSDDYSISITLDGNGAMSVDPDLEILYGAFSSEDFDMNNYRGYYEGFWGINYNKDVVVGDANEDSVVNKADTQVIVNHLLNRSQDNADADAMDTNADGNINVADVIGLSNIIKKQK